MQTARDRGDGRQERGGRGGYRGRGGQHFNSYQRASTEWTWLPCPYHPVPATSERTAVEIILQS